MKKNNPTDALVAVTYNCNAKCTMCNIWQQTSQNEMMPIEYSKLPKSLVDINITGGEPFLRQDLVDIINVITQNNPKVRIVISSNGFLTRRIVEYMKEIKQINPRTALALSLDGINSKHNETRGIPNAFDLVMNTIDGLKLDGFDDIRLGYTASTNNIEELPKVYELTKELGVEFTVSVVHNSDNYFNIDSNQMPEATTLDKYLNNIIKNESKTLNLRKLGRTFYMKGLSKYAHTNKRELKCRALKDFFYLDPQANVYPCNILEKPIGSLREKSFSKIWAAKETDNLRSYCEHCNSCWMVCTAKSSIRKEPWKVSAGIGKNLLEAYQIF